MDTDSVVDDRLLERKINDGRRLLRELDREGFEVAVALWASTGEKGKWRLYIASKESEAAGFAAYRRVFAALHRLPSPLLTSDEVKVIRASDPFARDALKERGQHTGPDPIAYEGWRLGDTSVGGAYIYPPPPYHLTPADAVARAVSLMTGTQPGQVTNHSLVTFRDGSTKHAIPIGVQVDDGGLLVIKFVDVANGQKMTVPASEVIGID